MPKLCIQRIEYLLAPFSNRDSNRHYFGALGERTLQSVYVCELHRYHATSDSSQIAIFQTALSCFLGSGNT